MMKMKKTIAIASVIAGLGIGSVGAGTVFAAQHNERNQGTMTDLVNALAQKFHLSPADVQSVIDQQRKLADDQRKKQGADRFAAMLVQAVKDGKITQAQADLVTAKHAEIKTFQAGLQGKSVADRQAAMKTEQDALKQWATDNKIPEQYVLPFRGGFGGGMMKGKGASEGFRGRGGMPGRGMMQGRVRPVQNPS